jgi:tripartite-type tricarboxylate transporter receptor subunit TctC
MPSVLPHVRVGRLRGIAVSSAKRSSAAPEIPTVGETVPGFAYVTWYGVFAPAATPRDVIAKLNAEIVRTLQNKEIAQRLQHEGAEPEPGTPEALTKWMHAEYDQWKKTIAKAHLKLE